MKYSEFIASQILNLIADGWTLERIQTIDGMPSRSEFLKWRRNDAKLSTKYEKAIQDRVAFSFDKLSDIAFDLLNPENTQHNGRMSQIKVATDIHLKLMGLAVMIVQGYSGGSKDGSAVPHIRLEFVKSTEERPPEAG